MRLLLDLFRKLGMPHGSGRRHHHIRPSPAILIKRRRASRTTHTHDRKLLPPLAHFTELPHTPLRRRPSPGSACFPSSSTISAEIVLIAAMPSTVFPTSR